VPLFYKHIILSLVLTYFASAMRGTLDYAYQSIDMPPLTGLSFDVFLNVYATVQQFKPRIMQLYLTRMPKKLKRYV